MRLLVVSQYFWPENFRINDLVADLVARGHEVTVLTGIPNYPEGLTFPDFKRAPARFAEYAGASIVRVPILPRGKGSLRLAFNYLSFVLSGLSLGSWRLRNRPFDAIFVFEVSPITVALPALLLSRTKHAPVLMWVLDLWPDTLSAVGVFQSRWILDLVGYLVRFIYRRCDRILVQSRAFAANVEQFGGHPARIRYFPGWAESLFLGPLGDLEVAPELLPYRDTFNVLFAGNIGDAQDFPAILDAVEALDDLPQVRWLIVGDGRAAEFVRSQIQERGLGSRAILLGRQPIERMPSFFKGADALLVSLKKHPIFSMTIPGKVQSFLATGLPLLGMLDGEGARIILESGAGLVAGPGQGRELADGVRTLASMPRSERQAMGERGRNYCHQEFDRKQLIGSLETWMGEVASSTGPVKKVMFGTK
jgi:glycosyltransferase involved in cell wall biosynthesis